ncbi:hypothetical protein AAY473_016343 [Plecturocebus cupreus]
MPTERDRVFLFHEGWSAVTGSCYIDQAGLELLAGVTLPPPSHLGLWKCWDYRPEPEPPHLALETVTRAQPGVGVYKDFKL